MNARAVARTRIPLWLAAIITMPPALVLALVSWGFAAINDRAAIVHRIDTVELVNSEQDADIGGLRTEVTSNHAEQEKDHELLVRIDERTKKIEEMVASLRADQQKMADSVRLALRNSGIATP